jgi:hypothetical protein
MLAILLSLCVTALRCADVVDEEVLTPQAATAKQGSKVTVEFRIKGSGSNAEDGYGERYSAEAWDSAGSFFLRFSPWAVKQLRATSRPMLDHYCGDRVRSTGTVEILDFGKAGKHGVIPARKLTALRQVRIWLEWDLRPRGQVEAGGAVFHPSVNCLKLNGYNPDKAGDIELSNACNLVSWSREQPWMLLHELAHAHHTLILGENRRAIATAYKAAMEKKLYDNVAYLDGSKGQACAATNGSEYYAELTEAFFGRNDWFPFTPTELQKHDPAGFKLMQDTCGRPQPNGVSRNELHPDSHSQASS